MTLKIPEGGLLLEGPSSNDPNLPLQAFPVNLSDNIIESLISCVQKGGDIQLALGSTPTLHFGTQSHQLTPPPDSFPHELYLTQPYESTREAKRIPHTMSLFKKFNVPTSGFKPSKKVADDSSSSSKITATKSNKSSISSGLDSDLETLQNGLAAHDAREKTRISKPPTTKRGPAKSKLIPGYGSSRSLSTSPALVAVRSPPETHSLSASQQVVERKKEQRSGLVHELAVKDRSFDYLQNKWEGQADDLKPTLEKVADYSSDKEKWVMRKNFWKELDVWNYNYSPQEERQAAIDNAVRQYDKQRMSAKEPEWQKLLPKEERGKGKCLSVLQASLAKKTEVLNVETPVGGEPMARSSSNPLPAKPKKPTAQEAQAKRLLGKSKPSSAAGKPVPATQKSTSVTQKPASSAPKQSPTKPKTVPTKSTNGRVLSQEFIENSDSSGDDPPLAQAKPKAAPPKPASVTKETVVVKSRPIIREPREPVRQQPTKRPREDEDSSSSSGAPLSKRFKDKQPLRPSNTLKHRQADSSNRVHVNGSTINRNKATSPTKSSPLASSPPTNASDLEDVAPVVKKRKAEIEAKPVAVKRRQISEDVMSQAQYFKRVYQKYTALHHEIAALDNPPNQKLADLLDIRERLVDMKSKIYKQYSSDRD